MKKKLSKLSDTTKASAEKVSSAVSKTSKAIIRTGKTVGTTILDQDGNGDFNQDDIKILTEKGMNSTKSAIRKVTEVLSDTVDSTIMKDAAAGAVVGAAVAIPIPIIGPASGAVVGAGLGAYKNLTGKTSSSRSDNNKLAPQSDILAEILKLGELKEKGLITEKEFEVQKHRLLGSNQ